MGSLATAATCSEVNMEILIKNLLNHSLQAIFNPTRNGPWNQQMSHQPPHYTHMHGIWWQCVIWHSVVSFGRWLDLCLEYRSHRQKLWDQLVFLFKSPCFLSSQSHRLSFMMSVIFCHFEQEKHLTLFWSCYMAQITSKQISEIHSLFLLQLYNHISKPFCYLWKTIRNLKQHI